MATMNYLGDTMIEISLKELDEDHTPKYKVEFQKVGSPIVMHRYFWNPMQCKDFILELDKHKELWTLYKLEED